jgi:serine/threonine protein kinase
MALRRVARFEGFELDLRTAELCRVGDVPQKLSDQPFQILAMLLEHPGDLVNREDIRKSLWPNGTIVEFEHSINAAINRLRLALGDSAESPRFIETLARRGYRWKTPVDWMEGQPQAAAAPQASANGNWIGKKVSHYRVLEILGGGGMGVVYRAEDLKLGRRVALKFLPEELADDSAAMQRFEREARAASALNHPNICTIYEVEEHEAQPFIVMELLEGWTLRELIPAESSSSSKDPPVALPKLFDIAIQIAAGLEAAHSKGIIHRDIKPANIFVTTSGHVKLLDFGLAKLQELETLETDPQGTQSSQSKRFWSPYLTLTRTGTPIGTAGYMSPEQIRGEKLDARTDLFNLGLVLYEMATGRRAFKGETAPSLQAAILNLTPTPVRKMHAEIPTKLEAIINKALEKNREKRYQAASEMRAELESLKREIEPRHPLRRWALVAGGLVLLGSSAAIWFAVRRPWSRIAISSLKLRQLTNNSFENPVLSGTISPDGKYLAYSDRKGIHLKLVETGETRNVPEPGALKENKVDWEIKSWFPDDTRFLADALPQWSSHIPFYSSEDPSIWIVSVLGGPPRKLRDNANAYSISPDGSLISFGTKKGTRGDREVWLMGGTGEQARKLYDTDEGSSIDDFDWLREGRRVTYWKADDSGYTLLSRDLEGGPPTTILSPSETKNIDEYLWLPDGRLIYSVPEPDIANTCNYWMTRRDALTGKTIEEPTRLTTWSGFCMGSTSVTADGKRLAYGQYASRLTSYVADLVDGGTGILRPKHFPMSESSDGAADWTIDSKALILVSNRNGQYGIYKQFLDQDKPEPIVTEGYGRNPRVTPDGQNILYLGKIETGVPIGTAPEPVMRVSVTGGPSQLLFVAKPWSLISCAKPPSTLCVIAEPTEDRKQLIFSSVDPFKSRGPELARFALDPNNNGWTAALSPDGTHIAVTRSPTSPIYILSLRGQTTQQIQVKGWSNLFSLIWSADGRGLFVAAGIHVGSVLLYVDLSGNAHPLWEYAGFSRWTEATPSPDGHHLAFTGWTVNGNIWMMENF